MKNPMDLFKDADILKEVLAVNNAEKYLDHSFYQNQFLSNIDHVIFAIDFRVPKLIYLSKNTDDVFGYPHDEMWRKGVPYIYELTHPDDLEIQNTQIFPAFMNYFRDNKPDDLSKLKFSYTYRMRQKNGSYDFLIARFFIILLGETGIPLIIMGTMSNIDTVYSNKNELYCEIVEYKDGKKPQQRLHRIFSLNKTKNEFGLTKKEMEVLQMVAKGMTSKEVAHLTNRNIETIHTHRKNIIRKTKRPNMASAISLAQENNWI